MTDPFERLGLPRRFSIDADELERQYLALSREAHPDFHSGSGAEAQADAETASAAINEAYATLKDPFRRAEALMELLGGPNVNAQKEMPPAFLMEMLELRERIEQADTVEKAAIESELKEREGAIFDGIAELFAKCEPGSFEETLLISIRGELNVAKYLRGLLRDLRNS
jgi:molecular chaperone HscB